MSDKITWHAEWAVRKYRYKDGPLYDVVRGKGNLLVYGGASALWERLIGTSVTAFDNTNAYLGVGDSTTATSPLQTDLQAVTNKHREAMDATFPDHDDGDDDSDYASIVFESTFESADANFDWNEWGIFNASTNGRMLNRKVTSMGTKESPEEWTLTVRLSLA